MDNKRLVENAFDAWARGEGDVFDLLSDDARWTITGTSPLAGTYSGRQELLDRAITPLSARLTTWIRPTVASIVADGDRVVVLWSGHGVARDGEPYDNVYSWHLRFEGGAVVEVVAFFDAPTLSSLFARVPPAG